MDAPHTIVFQPADEGGYTAYILDVPGAVSEGETIEEARDMVIDALKDLQIFKNSPKS